MQTSFDQYKPGTHKLMQHLDHLQKIKNGLIVAPLHVSIWPTLRCQCQCDYCCCRNEEPGQGDLFWQEFITAIDALAARGTKAIEFAGGGEPLLWPQFSKAVLYAKNKGLKVSLITNGLALPDISKEILAELAWIRVSLQSVQHAEAVNFKYVQAETKVSASMIYAPGIDFGKIHQIVKARNLVTRIAIAQPSVWGDGNDAKMIVNQYGAPFFFADKPKGVPAGCYMAWLRAAIDWKGFFLPCPSVMVTDHSGKVKEAFRLCHVSDLGRWLDANSPRDLGFRCAFCLCGKEHNDLIHGIIEGVVDNEFV